MDTSDITKVANRKRINVDIEKLQEKVSRETTNIIQTKVEQYNAIWELREKLQTAEGDVERLQRALHEALAQREADAARLQDELRRRPETLNRCAAARELAATLEEHVGRVAATVRRCAADRAHLAAAYERAAAATGDAARGQREDAARRQREDAARRAAVDAEKERTISELREAPRLLWAEFTAELERGRAELARLEREAGAAAAVQAEARAREEAAAAHERAEARERELAAHLQEMNNAFDNVKEELKRVSVEKELLEGEIQERGKRASSAERALRAQVAEAEARAAAAVGQAERARAEAGAASERERAEAAAAAERQAGECAATIARLMQDLVAESAARARASQEAERLRDDLARLRAALKNKEEETAQQMKIVKELCVDKEQLQAKVTAMEATIETVQENLTMIPGRATAPHCPREPAEQDAPAPVDDPLDSFFSDSSLDSLDSQKVNQCFEALNRGERPPSLASLKRRRTPKPQLAKNSKFFKTSRRAGDQFKGHN